jgi:SCF-associated factor 1
VLVNDELANRKSGSESSYEDQTFPRLKLVDGREMPGMKDFDDWKEGRPDWQLDVEA